MTWFISGSVTVTNGSKVVTVNDGYDTANIVRGDAIIINDQPPQEINTTRTGEIELLRPWPYDSVTNGAARVLPTSADFQQAAANLRHATSLTIENTKAINEWTTALGTVTFTDPETLTQYEVKTPRQLELEGQIQVDDASGFATAAETSATAAATSATAAATSETIAIGAADAAGVSEANALAYRNTAKTYRDQAEAAKSTAVIAKDDAVAAQVAAEAAKVGLETARDTAVAAKVAAETARDQSQASAAAAGLSETNAKASETAAAGSAAAALASQQEAAQSETNAATSESNAAASASSASTAAGNAAGYRNQAQLWATEAEDVLVSGVGYSALHYSAKADAAAANALIYQNNANTYKLDAQAARDAAQAAQALAEAAQGNAEAAAFAANTSASNAAASESAAAGSATTAGTHASDALAHKNAAATSAGQAATSASNAAAAQAASELARDEAQAAAATLQGATLEMGGWDASSGTLPTIPQDGNGQNISAFWKITAAGTLNGEIYGVGDSLVYSATLNDWYKIDNTESVTSVNGLQGVVTLGPTDVGAAPASHNHDTEYRPIGWVPSWDDVTGKPSNFTPQTLTKGNKTYWYPNQGVFFENGDHAISHNDGGGNFNIRVGHYWDAGAGIPRYSDAHSGIHLNLAHENNDPYFDVAITELTSATGALADAEIAAWNYPFRIYSDRVRTAAVHPNANKTHDLGKSDVMWKDVYGVRFYQNGEELSTLYAAIAHNHDTEYFPLSGGSTTGDINVKGRLKLFTSQSISPVNGPAKVYNGVDCVIGSENLAFLARGDDVTDRMAWMVDYGTTGNFTEYLTLMLHNGFIGINNPAPSYELDVLGSAKATHLRATTSTTVGKVETGKGNSMLSQWNTTGTLGRFYWAPRKVDDTDWDWAKEFGFDWNTEWWYSDTNFQIRAAAPTDDSHAVRKDYLDNELAKYIPLVGDAILDGDLHILDHLYINNIRSRSGDLLNIAAGEAMSHMSGQTSGEVIHLAAEDGIKIYTSPDNWASGWTGRNEATLLDTGGNTTLPGQLTTGRYISIGGSGSGRLRAAGLTTGNTQVVGISATAIYLGNPDTKTLWETASSAQVSVGGNVHDVYHTGNKPLVGDILNAATLNTDQRFTSVKRFNAGFTVGDATRSQPYIYRDTDNLVIRLGDGSTVPYGYFTVRAGGPTQSNDLINKGFGDTNYAPLSHSHSYLSLSGGTLTGNLTLSRGTNEDVALFMTEDSGQHGTYVYYSGASDNITRYGTRNAGVDTTFMSVARGSTTVEFPGSIKEGGTALSNKYAASNHTHSQYAAALHSHDYVPLSGGTMTGLLIADGGVRLGVGDSLYVNNSSTLGLKEAAGNYGTVSTFGTRSNYGGYSIHDAFVFMGATDNAKCGIYNDVDNEWMIELFRNGAANLYHNGSKKLETTASGATVTGTLTATVNVTWSSDERLKTDYTAIDSPLAKAAQVWAGVYTLKSNGRRYAGITAQTLQAVLPEGVYEDEEGMLKVDAGAQHGLTFAALGEAHDRIQTLEAEVAELKELVKALMEK